MRLALRTVGADTLRAACLVLGTTMFLGCPSLALGATTPAAPISGALVVPGMERLDGGQQLIAAGYSMSRNPEAIANRQASNTRFEGLTRGESARLASVAFPNVVGHAVSGAPRLAAGQRLIDYPTTDSALIDVGHGKREVIESSAPVAVVHPGGSRDPIDLRLVTSKHDFRPVSSPTDVRIPKQLAQGAALPGVGISVTPVDANGIALDSASTEVQGTSVFYPNSQIDTDTLVRPTASGLETDTILRSTRSPRLLSFRISLPAAGRLVADPGVVRVMEDDVQVASILEPSAYDATGRSVPVAVRVSGDTLRLSIGARAGEYEYPILVDPTVVDTSTLRGSTNWTFTTNNPSSLCWGNGPGLELTYCESPGAIEKGQYGYLSYTTQGESKIIGFSGSTIAPENPAFVLTYMAIAHTSYEAGPVALPESEESSPHELTVAGTNGNTAIYEAIVTKSESTYGQWRGVMTNPEVRIVQEKSPAVNFDTTDEKVEGGRNALYGNKWVSAVAGSFWLAAPATDPGIGIKKETWASPQAPKWGQSFTLTCKGIQCSESRTSLDSLKGSGAESLPDGEGDTVEVKVEDAAGLSATKTVKPKIDDTPPHGLTLSGLPGSKEISDGQQFVLKASATDGTSPTPSSGIASIALSMDGQPIGNPSKVGCTPGPCVANGEWTVGGEGYAAGQHMLVVTATDNAGNVGTEEFPVTIHHATSEPVGPGAVNRVTGELRLQATDVSEAAGSSELTVSRSFGSRHLTAAAEGPLGPQWTLAVGNQEHITKLGSSAVLWGLGGSQTVLTRTGIGTYSPPPGDGGMTLKEVKVEGATNFLLTTNGTVTTFAIPKGGSGGLWEPSISEGPGATNITTYTYQTEAGVTEPTEELAPVPAGVSCAPILTKGCRALTFKYAAATTAGEKPSEWGEFKGRLKEVLFTAYNPASKEMKTSAVEQYAYDKLGRLRAAWNPGISPALKSDYGYDAEGHVTSVAAPGQQPWLLEHGTIPADAGAGRILAIRRPAPTSASEQKTELEQAIPASTGAPTLSSTKPAVGSKISVSANGTWTGSPLAFIYHWEDCNGAGAECAIIPGAVNQNYYPVASDAGHTLVAQVVALNATGATAASSAATAIVESGTPNTPLPEPPSVGTSAVWTIDYRVPVSGTGAPNQMTSAEVGKWGQKGLPSEATAFFGPDEPMGWPARLYTRAKIDYLDSQDRVVNTATPAGGISTSEYNSVGEVVRSLSPDNRAKALAEGTKSVEAAKLLDTESTYNSEGTELLSVLGPQHTVGLPNGTQAEAREHTVYTYNEGAPAEGGPYHLVTTMTKGAVVAGVEEPASVRKTTTSYSGQLNLGWKLGKPTSVTTDPSGLKLAHTTSYEAATGSITETRNPAAGPEKEGESNYIFKAAYGGVGTGNGQFKEPRGIASDNKGDFWIADTGNNRLQELSHEGKYLWKEEAGSGTSKLTAPEDVVSPGGETYWVADTGESRLMKFAKSLGLEKDFAEGLIEKPSGIVIDPVESTVWATSPISDEVDEYLSSGEPAAQYGSPGSGERQFKEPHGIAVGPENNLYIADTGNNRIEEITYRGKYVRTFGSLGSGAGQLKAPRGVFVDREGDVWVADTGNNRIEEFGPSGTSLQTFGEEGTTEGKLKAPSGITIDSEGNAWIANTGDSRIEKWGSPPHKGAHATQTIYYGSAANPTYPGCGSHPEWASLPCQTQPSQQPLGSLPQLQVTTYTYNIWDEPETTTSTTGSTTRTYVETYDNAGRLKTTTVTATTGVALPTYTDAYNEQTGVLEKQSSTTEGKVKTITSTYNTVGQLTAYTDSDENTSTYEYDIDGRIHKSNDGKGTQTYTYSETTNELTTLLDSAGAMSFTATYDVEGHPLTEGYPNGMIASYAYNATGTPTSLEYKKTTHCTEKCTWFTDVVVPSIHGQWTSQSSTLSRQSYTYDAAGRLTQVQSTPTGKGCTTRIYSYDEDTNRKSVTKRESATEACATEGGTTETHSYDEADRLTDTGTTYNSFGDMTAVPAADAGGSELTNTFYVDDQVQSQTQNGQTVGFNLDPIGRARETVSTGKKVSDIVSHFAGPGGAPSWTANSLGEWTRNITGIAGTLVAIQSNAEPAVLQLTNLHGDIVATAYASETATELASKADTSEFGIPSVSAPSKYSWLGSIELPTELASGVTEMGRRSYLPQIGRFLQPDSISGGSANPYSYTFGDPVNSSDPSGASSIQELVAGHAATVAAEYQVKEEAERRAAEEALAKALATKAAEEAEWSAELAAGPQYISGEWGEWEEWEEWEEEEGSYEYATARSGAPKEAQMSSAVLYESLGAGFNGQQTEGTEKDTGGFRGNCGGNSRCKARGRHIGRGVPTGNVCDGLATVSYFVPGVGEFVGSLRGVAGLLLLGACG
jgi:RHS repeat-associated protein